MDDAADGDRLPKVTPYLVRRAADMCARRLGAEHRDDHGRQDPVNRSRLRTAFLDAVRVAHTLDVPLAHAPWRVLPGLEPEEVAVFQQARHWYTSLFGARPGRLVDHECDTPTEVPRYGVRIGGWVDLTFEHDDGTRELRQLDLWGGTVPEDPLDDPKVWLACLRLRRFAGDARFLVSSSDLVRGAHREREVRFDVDLPGLRDRFERALSTIRSRADTAVATMGADCGSCRFVHGCEHHPGARLVQSRSRADLLPATLTLTPTSLDTWHRCRRAWRNQYVLSVPASDESTPSEHGQRVHALLSFLHADGSCADEERLADVVAGHGADARLRAELLRHRERCPATSARLLGQELTVARFHKPYPPFMATARLDVAWVQPDGVLDVREYKTGAVWHSRVADDPRARLQAWVSAPLAARHGLRLRLRYEHLSPEVVDDPDPWEPDDEELRAVEAELHDVALDIRGEARWRGVRDPEVCASCRYRSICPDSATPSDPVWPRVDTTGAERVGEASGGGV